LLSEIKNPPFYQARMCVCCKTCWTDPRLWSLAWPLQWTTMQTQLAPSNSSKLDTNCTQRNIFLRSNSVQTCD